MILKAAVLAWLQTLPVTTWPKQSPETKQERLIRLETTANAIVDAGKYWPWNKREHAAMLGTIIWFESKLSYHVHAGLIKGDCKDFLVQSSCRSISIFQMQQTELVPLEVWKTLAGTDYDSTLRASTYATKVLIRARKACARTSPKWVVPTFAAYATGGKCEWEQAPQRARFFMSILVKIRANEAKLKTEIGAS